MSEQGKFGKYDVGGIEIDGRLVAYNDTEEFNKLHPGMKFGIFDVEDGVWLGNPTENGPKLFQDFEHEGQVKPGLMMASLCAIACGMQVGRVTKIRVKTWVGEEAMKKDEVPTKYGVEEALKRYDDGHLT